jgi:hypothetical protein
MCPMVSHKPKFASVSVCFIDCTAAFYTVATRLIDHEGTPVMQPEEICTHPFYK